MTFLRPRRVIPADWWDPGFEHRLRVTATNESGGEWHDHLVSYTVPAGITVDAGSLRVIEHAASGPIDRAFDWRYGMGATHPNDYNRLPLLPCSISGQTVTWKALGRWQDDETRTFGLYWSDTNGATALDYHHLGVPAKVPANGWTVTITAGTAGDAYHVVAGGVDYSYTMLEGNDAPAIASALLALINAGAVAYATVATNKLTVMPATTGALTFTVANTGTSVPANVAVARPQGFPLQRIGPDTVKFPANRPAGYYAMSLPYGKITAQGDTGCCGNMSAGEWFRLMYYGVYGDVNDHGLVQANPTSLSVTDGRITGAGSMTFDTRSGDVDWAGTYSYEYQNVLYAGRKTDDTDAGNMLKPVDLLRMRMTLTCMRAYSPRDTNQAQPSNVWTGVGVMATLDNNYNGNATMAAGNKKPYAYQAEGGAITEYAALTDLHAVPVEGTAIWMGSNSSGVALLVHEVTFTDWGTQTPSACWYSSSNGQTYLQITGLTHAAQVPQNAQITFEFSLATHRTPNASTTGDVLMVDEALALLRSYQDAPTVALMAGEQYRASADRTARTLSDRALAGHNWMRTNALANTGLAANHAYGYDLGKDDPLLPQDGDGNFPHSMLLAGLTLRYLRTKDPAIVPILQAAAQWHVDIEQAAVSAYGSWWEGTAPYLYAPYEGAAWAGNTEGGIQGQTGAPPFVDPLWPGYPSLGPNTYSLGQVRRSTSIDQMMACAFGLYHYLYLLRDDPVVSVSTTYANALAYLGRMATKEAAVFASSAQIAPNLLDLVNGDTPTNGNGVGGGYLNAAVTGPGKMALPYYGNWYGDWMVSNQDNVGLTVPSVTHELTRGWSAPNSDRATMVNYVKGVAMGYLNEDFGRHSVQFPAGLAAEGVAYAPYHTGWPAGNEHTDTKGRYNAGANPTHWFDCDTGGIRDSMAPSCWGAVARAAWAAIYDPSWQVPVEPSTTVPVLEALDRLVAATSLYGPEPTTSALRIVVEGFLGTGSDISSRVVDINPIAYALLGAELYLLAKRSASGWDPSTYYQFSNHA